MPCTCTCMKWRLSGVVFTGPSVYVSDSQIWARSTTVWLLCRSRNTRYARSVEYCRPVYGALLVHGEQSGIGMPPSPFPSPSPGRFARTSDKAVELLVSSCEASALDASVPAVPCSENFWRSAIRPRSRRTDEHHRRSPRISRSRS